MDDQQPNQQPAPGPAVADPPKAPAGPAMPPGPMPGANPTGPAGPSPADPKAAKGYGKRPMWQWVVIYLVVAVVVYGIIYFVWIRKSGTTSSGY